MSASVADILLGAGFVPIVPTVSPPAGNAETQAGSCVPTVPIVPDRKYKAAIGTPDPNVIRTRLLALAAADYRDAGLVRALGDAFLRECDGYSDAQLKALLSMFADDTDRRAGRVPKDDTAAILCRSCGPVWIHPSIAAVLPVVDGWPRALGCPWCFIRARGIAIPRAHIERSPHRVGTNVLVRYLPSR